MIFRVKAIKLEKDGTRSSVEITGHSVPDDLIMVSDLRRVTEVEQFLEKLTGIRWHFEQVDDPADRRQG